MKQGDIVECILGSGYLLEGTLYTIEKVTKSSNLLLYEIDPPEGFTCFDKNRFKLVDPPELPENFLEEILMETDCIN